MASLRKFNCYRNVVRAYTRKSKYRRKGFINSVPAHRIVKFDMGNVNGDYKYVVRMRSKETMQIRHNAIESARLVCNRKLVARFGPKAFHLQINMYPHHILRENKMLSGAGADRLSSGMKQAFGKTMGVAAQVKRGKVLFTLRVHENALATAREVFKQATARLPCKTMVEVEEIKK